MTQPPGTLSPFFTEEQDSCVAVPRSHTGSKRKSGTQQAVWLYDLARMLFSPQGPKGHTQQVNHLFLELTSSIQRSHSPDLPSWSRAGLSRLFSNLATTQNETAEHPRSGYLSVTPLNLYLLHSDWRPPLLGLYLRTQLLFVARGGLLAHPT